MAKRGGPPVEIALTGNERRRLESWARRHSTAQNLAMRCKIILLCPDPSLTGKEIASKVGCNPATVSKWHQRFAEKRLDGLIDEPRSGAVRTIGDEVGEQVVIDALESAPKDATHWSTRSMAERHGISHQHRPDSAICAQPATRKRAASASRQYGAGSRAQPCRS
jgi:hypothetical protein